MAKQSGQVDFAEVVLSRLGLPLSPDNVQALTAWENAEGGAWHNTASYNPLNTTQAEPGSAPMNSDGVQAYTSWGQGVNATVATLQNGRYGPVLAALGAGNSAAAVTSAVAASPWGTEPFSPSIGTRLTAAQIRQGAPGAARALGTAKPGPGGTGTVTTAAWYEPWTWGSAIGHQVLSGVGADLMVGVAVLAGAALIVWGAARASGAGQKAAAVIEAVPAAAAATGA